MAILNIKDPRAHELATQIAHLTGLSLTDAVLLALRDQAQKLNAQLTPEARYHAVLDFVRRCHRIPVADERTPEEILYDEQGLPR